MKHRRIVIPGGTGFVGRHLIARLVEAGREVVVPTRVRERARHLLPLPRVEIVEADARDPESLSRVAAGADAFINLVGLLNESGGATFAGAHVGVAEAVIAACRANGIRRFVQMSALNADPKGPSAYLRSKGEAERRIVATELDWTIFQPSVIFGPEDKSLNLFAALGAMPVILLAGAQARFQPVYVGDVAEAFARALDDPDTFGRHYRLCGPDVYRLRELVEYAAARKGRHPLVIGLPDKAARLQAWVLEHLPGGLLSRDNLDSMSVDSVSDDAWPAQFGPRHALADTVPTYLDAPDPAASCRQSRR